MLWLRLNVTSRKLIICLLASMVMRRPLLAVVFINFSTTFSTQLPKRMQWEVANLHSLQLRRKSYNKRALEASSSTIK